MAAACNAENPVLVFRANLVHTPGSFGSLEVVKDAHVVVDNLTGTITHILRDDEVHQLEALRVVELVDLVNDGPGDSCFLLPGFVDCHIHAPQYSNTGTGAWRVVRGAQRVVRGGVPPRPPHAIHHLPPPGHSCHSGVSPCSFNTIHHLPPHRRPGPVADGARRLA